MTSNRRLVPLSLGRVEPMSPIATLTNGPQLALFENDTELMEMKKTPPTAISNVVVNDAVTSSGLIVGVGAAPTVEFEPLRSPSKTDAWSVSSPSGDHHHDGPNDQKEISRELSKLKKQRRHRWVLLGGILLILIGSVVIGTLFGTHTVGPQPARNEAETNDSNQQLQVANSTSSSSSSTAAAGGAISSSSTTGNSHASSSSIPSSTSSSTGSATVRSSSSSTSSPSSSGGAGSTISSSSLGPSSTSSSSAVASSGISSSTNTPSTATGSASSSSTIGTAASSSTNSPFSSTAHASSSSSTNSLSSSSTTSGTAAASSSSTGASSSIASSSTTHASSSSSSTGGGPSSSSASSSGVVASSSAVSSSSSSSVPCSSAISSSSSSVPSSSSVSSSSSSSSSGAVSSSSAVSTAATPSSGSASSSSAAGASISSSSSMSSSSSAGSSSAAVSSSSASSSSIVSSSSGDSSSSSATPSSSTASTGTVSSSSGLSSLSAATASSTAVSSSTGSPSSSSSSFAASSSSTGASSYASSSTGGGGGVVPDVCADGQARVGCGNSLTDPTPIGLLYRFNQPNFLGLDSDTLIIGDSGNRQLLRMDLINRPKVDILDQTSAGYDALFPSIDGMAMDANKHLVYLVTNNTVRQIPFNHTNSSMTLNLGAKGATIIQATIIAHDDAMDVLYLVDAGRGELISINMTTGIPATVTTYPIHASIPLNASSMPILDMKIDSIARQIWFLSNTTIWRVSMVTPMATPIRIDLPTSTMKNGTVQTICIHNTRNVLFIGTTVQRTILQLSLDKPTLITRLTMFSSDIEPMVANNIVPLALACDTIADRLLISDGTRATILEMTNLSSVRPPLQPIPLTLTYNPGSFTPGEMAFNSDRSIIWAIDTTAKVIIQYTAGTSAASPLATTGYTFLSLGGLVWDSVANTLYVTDPLAKKLLSVEVTSPWLVTPVSLGVYNSSVFLGGLEAPSSLALDTIHREIYISDVAQLALVRVPILAPTTAMRVPIGGLTIGLGGLIHLSMDVEPKTNLVALVGVAIDPVSNLNVLIRLPVTNPSSSTIITTLQLPSGVMTNITGMVVETSSRLVYALDHTQQVIWRVPLDYNSTLGYSASASSNFTDIDVLRFDPSSFSSSTRVSGMLVDPIKNVLFIGDMSAGSITQIPLAPTSASPSSHVNTVNQVNWGWRGPVGSVWDSPANILYVLESDPPAIVQLPVDTPWLVQRMNTLPLVLQKPATSIDLDSTNGRLFVTHGSTVATIPLSNPTNSISLLTVLSNPQGIIIDSTRNVTYIAVQDAGLIFSLPTNSSISGAPISLDTGIVKFSGPFGLCMTPDGMTLYVTDINLNSIAQIPLSHTFSATWLNLGSSIQLRQPKGVDFNSLTNELLVADSLHDTIVRVPLSDPTTSQPLFATFIDQPQDMAWDATRNKSWVLDTNPFVSAAGTSTSQLGLKQGRIILLDPNALTAAGRVTVISSATDFAGASSIELSSDGSQLYVADTAQDRIVSMSTTAPYAVTEFIPKVTSPDASVLDTQRDILYFIDTIQERIFQMPMGNTTAATAVNPNYPFLNLAGITIDSSAQIIYVTDSAANSIVRVPLTSGSGGSFAPNDTYQLNLGLHVLRTPRGLAFDSTAQVLWIANGEARTISYVPLSNPKLSTTWTSWVGPSTLYALTIDVSTRLGFVATRQQLFNFNLSTSAQLPSRAIWTFQQPIGLTLLINNATIPGAQQKLFLMEAGSTGSGPAGGPAPKVLLTIPLATPLQVSASVTLNPVPTAAIAPIYSSQCYDYTTNAMYMIATNLNQIHRMDMSTGTQTVVNTGTTATWGSSTKYHYNNQGMDRPSYCTFVADLVTSPFNHYLFVSEPKNRRIWRYALGSFGSVYNNAQFSSLLLPNSYVWDTIGVMEADGLKQMLYVMDRNALIMLPYQSGDPRVAQFVQVGHLGDLTGTIGLRMATPLTGDVGGNFFLLRQDGAIALIYSLTPSASYWLTPSASTATMLTRHSGALAGLAWSATLSQLYTFSMRTREILSIPVDNFPTSGVISTTPTPLLPQYQRIQSVVYNASTNVVTLLDSEIMRYFTNDNISILSHQQYIIDGYLCDDQVLICSPSDRIGPAAPTFMIWDVARQQFILSDPSTSTLWSVPISQPSATKRLMHSFKAPSQVALDSTNQQLYVVDQYSTVLVRMPLDPTQRSQTQIVPLPGYVVVSIAVDSSRQVIYFHSGDEVLYSFPISNPAAILGMHMTIGSIPAYSSGHFKLDVSRNLIYAIHQRNIFRFNVTSNTSSWIYQSDNFNYYSRQVPLSIMIQPMSNTLYMGTMDGSTIQQFNLTSNLTKITPTNVLGGIPLYQPSQVKFNAPQNSLLVVDGRDNLLVQVNLSSSTLSSTWLTSVRLSNRAGLALNDVTQTAYMVSYDGIVQVKIASGVQATFNSTQNIPQFQGIAYEPDTQRIYATTAYNSIFSFNMSSNSTILSPLVDAVNPSFGFRAVAIDSLHQQLYLGHQLGVSRVNISGGATAIGAGSLPRLYRLPLAAQQAFMPESLAFDTTNGTTASLYVASAATLRRFDLPLNSSLQQSIPAQVLLDDIALGVVNRPLALSLDRTNHVAYASTRANTLNGVQVMTSTFDATSYSTVSGALPGHATTTPSTRSSLTIAPSISNPRLVNLFSGSNPGANHVGQIWSTLLNDQSGLMDIVMPTLRSGGSALLIPTFNTSVHNYTTTLPFYMNIFPLRVQCISIESFVTWSISTQSNITQRLSCSTMNGLTSINIPLLVGLQNLTLTVYGGARTATAITQYFLGLTRESAHTTTLGVWVGSSYSTMQPSFDPTALIPPTLYTVLVTPGTTTIQLNQHSTDGQACTFYSSNSGTIQTLASDSLSSPQSIIIDFNVYWLNCTGGNELFKVAVQRNS